MGDEARVPVDFAGTFITIGGLLVAALAADYLCRRTPLPRVTVLLLIGVLAGPVLGFVSEAGREALFPPLATLALAMIGFLLGEEFDREQLRERGGSTLALSAVEALTVLALVTAGLWALGMSLTLASLLGAIGVATAPAATMAVVQEARAEGPLTRSLLGVVAIDDVWGLVGFAVVAGVTGSADGGGAVALAAVREVGGAVILGVAIGLPAAYLSGRIRSGEPTLLEALGVMFLVAGLAESLETSSILTAVVAGAVVTNVAGHHTRTFRQIEHIEWPFLALFFLLAGADLDVEALSAVGVTGVGFVLLRATGKILGAGAGATLTHAPPTVRRWLGVALLPQAGVALGLALSASTRIEDGAQLLTIAVASTVVFELLGAGFTKLALVRSGEAGAAPPDDEDDEDDDAEDAVPPATRGSV